MSCSLCEIVERQRVTRARPTLEAALRVDRAALNRALGGRGELLEADALRATGRPTVNAGRMWALLTANLYQSGDLVVIATREALQNALDATRAAVRARQIRAEDSLFEVVLDQSQSSWSLTWADRGIGMDAATIVNKFLSLGDTGKADATDSGEAAGGFGVAKAVILGVSKTFRWEMHTRDNLAVAEGRDRDVEVFGTPPRQGTRITVHDIDQAAYWHWDPVRGEYVGIEDRLREVLAANDLPGFTLTFQNQRVEPLFARRGGSRIALEADWGPGTTAALKAYRRAPGDRNGAYYVRLNGLYQFKAPSRRHGIPADIVLDLHTSVRPGQTGYPVNAARDALLGSAAKAFNLLVEQVEQEAVSAGRSQEDEVFDDFVAPTGVAAELRESLNEAMVSPDVLALLHSAAGGLAAYYEERATERHEGPIDSNAPASRAPGQDEEPLFATGPIGPGLKGAAAGLTLSASAPAGAVAVKVREQLANAEATFAVGGVRRVLLTGPVVDALGSIASGVATDAQVDLVSDALQQTAEAATMAGGGGLLAVAAVPETIAALQEAAGRPRRRGLQNPFAGFAALRVSKKHYDRGKARRFVKNYAKWIPYLLAWDATLRLVANEARIRRAFASGFVLDDTVNGMAALSTDRTRIVIYCHPDRLAEVVRAHKRRSIGVAVYLHSLAVHELTHADGRMGDGHGESFTSAREDLGRATGHLLPAIAALAVQLLGLPADPDNHAARAARLSARIAELEDQVRRARADAGAAKRRVRVLERSLEAAQAPAPTHGTPRTRIGWSDLAGWLAGWRAIEARPASEATRKAREAHLHALPEELVAEAPLADLDRLDALLVHLKPHRGHRQGHPTTRLQDATDRARAREKGIEIRLGADRAAELLHAIGDAARAQLPEGLTEEDLDGFLARHDRALRWSIAQSLGRYPP